MSLKSSQWKREEFFSPSSQNHQIIMSIRDGFVKVKKPIYLFGFVLCPIQFVATVYVSCVGDNTNRSKCESTAHISRKEASIDL